MPKHRIDGDEQLNPQLREVLQTLRGGISSTAEKIPLPDRFEAHPCEEAPQVVILDRSTRRTTTVPLFAYGEVRRVLSDLFR